MERAEALRREGVGAVHVEQRLAHIVQEGRGGLQHELEVVSFAAGS